MIISTYVDKIESQKSLNFVTGVLGNSKVHIDIPYTGSFSMMSRLFLAY